jgi:hypothetical protein
MSSVLLVVAAITGPKADEILVIPFDINTASRAWISTKK